jgi:hypothetical protein
VLTAALIHFAAATAVASVAVVATDQKTEREKTTWLLIRMPLSLSLYHPHVPRQNTSVFSLPHNKPKSSLPPPRPTPKHFHLLPPTQQSKILKNLFLHVSTKKHSLIYWIRGGRFVYSFRNLWQHLRNQRPSFQTQLENAGECRGLRCLSRAS